MSEENELKFILAKDGRNNFKLHACRGVGKGCERNKFRKQMVPCQDCIPCDDETETLGELQARLKKGDA